MIDGKDRGGILTAWLGSGGATSCEARIDRRNLRDLVDSKVVNSDVSADHFRCCMISESLGS